jgi:hypothetical protein
MRWKTVSLPRAKASVLDNSTLSNNVMAGSGVRLIEENIRDDTTVVLEKGELKREPSNHALEWSIKILKL